MTQKKRTRRINRGRGHSYEIDDEWVPGVTTLLGQGLPKPALINWAANMTAEYVIERLQRIELEGELHFVADELIDDLYSLNSTRDRPERLNGKFPRQGLAKVLANVRNVDRDQAARRGTEVHRLAEKLALGVEVEVPDELVGHVDSYIGFLEDWKPRNAMVEVIVINHRYRYMGTCDMICDLPSPWGRTLLDIKTSRSGIFGDTALQLAGYGRAETIYVDDETETPMPAIESYGAIHVRGDGYDVIPMDVTDEEWRCFLYAAEVGRWTDWNNHGRTRYVRGEIASPPSWPDEEETDD